MAFQYSPALRTNMIGQIQTTVGSSGVTLVIYSGAEPANTSAAATGVVLATISVPATFLTSTAGVASIANGPWSVAASAAGTAGYWRLINGTTVHVQGDCISDLVLVSNTITLGQMVIVNSFTATQGNA